MAEQQKVNHKILNLARKHTSLPTTHRDEENRHKIENIFANDILEKSNNLCLQKNYGCVGLNEMKQYLKKSKRINIMKKTNGGVYGLSMKSYTIKSNDIDDLLLTKQEVLKILNKEEKDRIQQQKQRREKHSIRYSRHRQKSSIYYDQHLQKYQEKIQKLNKYTLYEKRQNIHASEWKKILRTSLQLSNIYDKQQDNFEIIKRNGFKIKASSKINKEVLWLNKQKQNCLFEFLDGKSQKLKNFRIRDCVQ